MAAGEANTWIAPHADTAPAVPRGGMEGIGRHAFAAAS